MKMASPPLKLAVVFLAFGILWILCTDAILLRIAHYDLRVYDSFQRYSTPAFIVLSALLIYAVNRWLYTTVNRGSVRQRATSDMLAQKNLRSRTETVQHVIEAQEAERKKIGEELHDNINQLLGVVKLYIHHVMEHPDSQHELLPRCGEYLNQVIEEIRCLSSSLAASSLQSAGLLTSLEETVNNIQRARNIRIRLRAGRFCETSLTDNKKLMLFRIVQEQMNNILKHSGANEASIELDITGNDMCLVIRDNGRGFDPVSTRKGMGLSNIMNRLDAFNGSMEISSAPGKGTTIVAKVPVN